MRLKIASAVTPFWLPLPSQKLLADLGQKLGFVFDQRTIVLAISIIIAHACDFFRTLPVNNSMTGVVSSADAKLYEFAALAQDLLLDEKMSRMNTNCFFLGLAIW
jgi:hypothetical protein